MFRVTVRRATGSALVTGLALGCASGTTPSASAGAAARAVARHEAIVDTGRIAGAAYRVKVPRGWTGGLVLYAHGHQIPGSPPASRDPRLPAFRELLLARGFAVAHSDYSAQGWAVAEGIEDTEALRRYFVSRYGRPGPTFVVGHSMDGHIALAVVERYPDAYDGALPLCAPLTPALDFMAERLFGLLVAVEALVPGALPTSQGLTDAAAPGSVDPAAVAAALARVPAQAARLADRFEVRPPDLPLVVAYYYVILREVQRRAGGNAFDNTGTVYTGLGDDGALNRAVRRYRADPGAVAYLRQHYSPTGRLADPVLAVHTTYDPIVAAAYANQYANIAARAGAQDRFVARFVAADGHCAIGLSATGAAFDALRLWASSGRRPEGGELR